MYQIITDHILPFLFGAGGSGLVYYFLDKKKRYEETKAIKAEALDKMQTVYDKFVEDYQKKYEEMKQEYDERLKNMKEELDKVKKSLADHKNRCKNCKTN
ncbi:hypothetical protein ACI760_01295 [Capnocytophaga canimorsus]|uniref:hypothetical protein n=1 Tax=Capnocytophaga canimorsus TaxID=28188 RepID=UPI00249F857F|nr:hypothetical protein [Capnocytophaga canimorsus]WGU68546.1 hypothetical protein QIU19_00490 [Capnocytophaga canimorsus]